MLTEPMRRPVLIALVALTAFWAVLGGAGWIAWRLRAKEQQEGGRASPPNSCASPSEALSDDARADAGKSGDRLSGRSFQLPTGAPASLSCQDARRVVWQARSHFAAEPAPVDPRVLADATVDWLDPHGLWSASPDAPLLGFLRKHERELLHELEESPSHAECPLADEAGALMATWVGGLTVIFDDAERHAVALPVLDAWKLAVDPAFEDRAIVRPARDLARDLGRTVGTVQRSYGEALTPFARAARDRFVPPLTPSGWSRAVLAAALRAYLPQIDPHGGWAPLDEETSLYEVDLEALPPPRLWDHMVRTALGVRVDAGTFEPMAEHDLVLDVAQVPTAGLSVEQVEQLSIFDDGEPTPSRRVTVLREGESAPLALDVIAPSSPEKPGEEGGVLPSEWVSYGDGAALVVEIADVPDDLGELLAVTIARARAQRPPTGIVLDLRGNGGGSTDGANAALGIFMPGVRLFPMRRRDGVIETERAPEPPDTDRFTGPVATLVDGDTASAAEMIAGALASYRRGVIAGFRTYGKGCAQEYLDDDAHSGVLRLTTLVYALPDGTAVQRVGLLPGLLLGTKVSQERESTLSHALATWRGPDVRDRDRIIEVPWPVHHGHLGPCRDDGVCRALRALGGPRTAAVRGRH